MQRERRRRERKREKRENLQWSGRSHQPSLRRLPSSDWGVGGIEPTGVHTEREIGRERGREREGERGRKREKEKEKDFECTIS